MTDTHDDPTSAAPTSKELLRESWRQLKQVRGLAGLGVMSGLVCVVLFLLFFGPGLAWAINLGDEQASKVIVPVAVVLGVVAATLAGTFFEGAIISAALQQAEGTPTSARLALAGARKRFGRLMVWGLTDSTVNLALSMLRDKNNVFGNVLSAAGGLAWSVATYLALPVVMAEGVGPFAAIRRASALLRQTWGSALRVTVRFGFYLLPFILLSLAMIFGSLFLVNVNVWLAIAVLLFGLVLLLVVAAFSSIVKAYVKAQLYLYAAGQATSMPVSLLRGGIQAA